MASWVKAPQLDEHGQNLNTTFENLNQALGTLLKSAVVLPGYGVAYRPRAAFGWTFYGVAAGLKVVRDASTPVNCASTLTLLAPPGFLPL